MKILRTIFGGKVKKETPHIFIQDTKAGGLIKIILRRATTKEWMQINPVLKRGEIGIDLDRMILKIGDGQSTWGRLNPQCKIIVDENGVITDLGPLEVL